MEHNLKLTNIDGQLLEGPTLYRKLIGYPMYLAIARPDIIYAINILSQFVAKPHKPHLDAALTATRLCYLKGSLAQGILLWKYHLIVTQVG